MNKEQFYREDYKTFKPKYYLFCRESKFEVKKFAQLKENQYICREKQIKIEEL